MRRLLLSVVVFGVLALAASTALASSTGFDFESFTPGNINGQNGWSMTGGYDVAVVNTSSFADAASYGFGTKSLRISNSVATGAFGDQTIAPSLADASGEAGHSRFNAS